MCSPLALTAVAGAFQAYSAYDQGQQAKAVGNFNARQQENQAIKLRNQGTEKENDHRRAVAEMVSKQRAQFGASGVDVGSGSALDVVDDTQTLGDIDAMRIRSSVDDNVKSLNDQARLTRSEGKAAARAGKLKAVGSLFSTAGSVAGKWYTPKSAAVQSTTDQTTSPLVSQ